MDFRIVIWRGKVEECIAQTSDPYIAHFAFEMLRERHYKEDWVIELQGFGGKILRRSCDELPTLTMTMMKSISKRRQPGITVLGSKTD